MESGSTLSSSKKKEILSFLDGEIKGSFLKKYLKPPLEVRFISGGGSDRSFYRIKGRNRSVVLMVSPAEDGGFRDYLDIAQFLKRIGVGVPEIYFANLQKNFLLMEDVGDESLYLKFQKGISEEEAMFWYRKVIETLAHMQVEGGKKWKDCPPLHHRKFDYHALRWETEYFQKYFLEKYCRVSIPEKERLEQEFRVLAEKVSKEPYYFMHRDFQSQNIMIHEGSLRILDFQGGRRGLLHYDLASILKDAYVVLPKKIQKDLLNFYLKKLTEKGIRVDDYGQFYETFTLAGLQRNMQALGAFSYLSMVKGKIWFRQFIPSGVNYLNQTLKERRDFPFLSSLIEKISQLI
jgi:hypothetical protein